MPTFDNEYLSLGRLDALSYRDTVIHRLDPRAKLIATIAFIVTVVSFPAYELAGLLPFLLFPVILFALGDIPVGFIMKKVLAVSAFAVLIGVFNPLLDRQPLYHVHGMTVTGGWVSFLSILLKSFLTVTAALLLIATTSFPGICRALGRLGLPDIFIAQLLFLYRYLFVLAEETMRAVRARDLRSFGTKGTGVRPFVSLAGTLFLRTVERAESIHQAMLSRAFTGTLRSLGDRRFHVADAAFLVLVIAALFVFRTRDVVGAVGRIAERMF